MIADHVSNLHQYAALSENFRTAARFVEGLDLAQVAVGHYDIDGERVFANVIERELVETPHTWELHQKYADIHLILAGSEVVGCYPLSRLTEPPRWDVDADCALVDALDGALVSLEAGEFVIALPQDVHLPNHPGKSGAYSKKMIVKVRMD